MREINLGALRQQFNQAYAGQRRLRTAQESRLSQLDIKELITQGQRKITLLDETRKEDNIRTKLALEKMVIGFNHKNATKALDKRVEQGLAKITNEQKHFYLQERRDYDRAIRRINRTRLNALDKLATDTTIRNLYRQAEFDAGVELRAIQHEYSMDLQQIRFDGQQDLRKIEFSNKLTSQLGIDPTAKKGTQGWWAQVSQIMEALNMEFQDATELYTALQSERQNEAENSYLEQWMTMIRSSHNPPIGEEWRREWSLTKRGLLPNYRERQNKAAIEAAGGRVDYFQTPRQWARGRQPALPTQQAATSAVVAEDPLVFQDSMRSAARGTAIALQQLQFEQDNWLAQSAINDSWDKAEELKRTLGGMSVAERREYLQSGAVNTAFDEILNFYDNIKDPVQKQRVSRSVKKFISDVQLNTELGSVDQLKDETKTLIADSQRRLAASVMLNPNEAGVKDAVAKYDEVVGPLYPDAGALAFANKERDGVVFKARLNTLLGPNPKTQNFQQAEELLNSQEALDYLTPKDITAAFGVLGRQAKKHQQELAKKGIESIQQWTDKYGRSKQLVKKGLTSAVRDKDFSQLVQLAQSPEILPEDRSILNTMLAKAKAKLTPADGSVRGFAANEPIGYRGSQYKLGRGNRLVSDANGSRDMAVENNFREAFNTLLRNDPVQLREQIMGQEDPSSAVAKRKLFGGRTLTNEDAMKLGQSLTGLLGATPQQRHSMMQQLGSLYGEEADLVTEEALLTLRANTTDAVEKDRIQVTRMAFNPFLQGVLNEPTKATYTRSLETHGKLTARAVGVTSQMVSPHLQRVRDSVPAWTFNTMENVVEQLALDKALNTVGDKDAKQEVYTAEAERVSLQLAEKINLETVQYGEAATIEGLNTALSGILIQQGALDVPRSIVDQAGVDAPIRAMDFIKDMRGTTLAKHQHLLDMASVGVVHQAGPHAQYKLAKREDRAGSFVVVLEQGETIVPMRLKDGSLLSTTVEDIFLHGAVFNSFHVKTAKPLIGPQPEAGI